MLPTLVGGERPQLVRAAPELVVGDRRDELGPLAPSVELTPFRGALATNLDLPAGDTAVRIRRANANLVRVLFVRECKRWRRCVEPQRHLAGHAWVYVAGFIAKP